MPNAETLSALVLTATAFGDGVIGSAKAGEQPPLGGGGVGERLQRAEGLGRHDEQRGLGVEVGKRGHQVGGVDVGDEMAANGRIDVVAQRLIDHHRSQIGAADADVDDVGDRFAGVPLPLSAAELVGEGAHRVEDLVDVGHHVLAIDDQLGVGRQAQCRVQDGAILGGVDVDAGEHRVALVLETGLTGQAEQQLQRLAQHAMLGVIDVQIADVDGQFAASIGVGREDLPQMHRVDRDLDAPRAPATIGCR